MPVAPTYPGIYIEEIASGVRTITGVATSVAAFFGRTSWGDVNQPATIDSFGEFERKFGGLRLDSPMTFAIRDFFINGGSRAIIVRLFHENSTSDDGIAQITVSPSGGSSSSSSAGVSLQVQAASPGAWGNELTVEVEAAPPLEADVAARYGAGVNDFFNLVVTYKEADPEQRQVEVIKNLTFVTGSSRRFDRVLARESQFLRAAVDTSGDPLTNALPGPGKATASGGFGGNDGAALDINDYTGVAARKTGLYALDRTDRVDIFNLLCLPPDEPGGSIPLALYPFAMKFCKDRRAMFIADPLDTWSGQDAVATAVSELTNLGLVGPEARNAALFFPRVRMPNPLRGNQTEEFVPCGIIAGVVARTDADRGVWKAPAGIDGAMNGVQELLVGLTDGENGTLNQLGINCLRKFPVFGHVVWGSRTARGADQAADEYKYIPVRRLALFVEETLFRALKWVVFEPNDEPLWSQIRLNVGAFMQDLFRQGAFQGKTPQEAYLVKCDKETTTQSDINRGVVNILVGFAPLKPAEFVIIKIQQLAGQVLA
jgi:phage tail sheath protein FI